MENIGCPDPILQFGPVEQAWPVLIALTTRTDTKGLTLALGHVCIFCGKTSARIGGRKIRGTSCKSMQRCTIPLTLIKLL